MILSSIYTHENVRNVTEEGYINDHMAPNDGIPFTPMEDNGKDLQATPARGIPMDQMLGDVDYVNAHMVAKQGIPVNLADDGEYLHTSPVGGIPVGHMADDADYVNAHMAPKGRNVMIA